MIERLAVGRRDFVAGAAMLSAAASAGPALAAADNGAGIEAPWTGGGRIVRAGGVIQYRTLGPDAGKPVVLLPKVGGWIADWRPVAPLIGARPRVIAMALPGHGRSEWLGQPPPVDRTSVGLGERECDRVDLGGRTLH